MKSSRNFFITKTYARIIGACYAGIGIAFLLCMKKIEGALPGWAYAIFGLVLIAYGLARIFRKSKTNE